MTAAAPRRHHLPAPRAEERCRGLSTCRHHTRRRLPPEVAIALHLGGAVAAFVLGAWVTAGLLLAMPLLYVLLASHLDHVYSSPTRTRTTRSALAARGRS